MKVNRWTLFTALLTFALMTAVCFVVLVLATQLGSDIGREDRGVMAITVGAGVTASVYVGRYAERLWKRLGTTWKQRP